MAPSLTARTRSAAPDARAWACVHSLLLAGIIAYFIWQRYRESEMRIAVAEQAQGNVQYRLPPQQMQQMQPMPPPAAPPNLVYGR